MKQYDIIIIGAGASGLCAAVETLRIAASRGKKIRLLLLEKEKIPAKKILATGNGRCNLANTYVSESCYFDGGELVSRVFGQRGLSDCLEFFGSIGVPTAGDGSGRLYPMSRKASGVADALVTESIMLGAEIITEYSVRKINHNGKYFDINGEFECQKLIAAFGSLAGLPKNSVYNGEELLSRFNIKTEPFYPCLTPLVLDKTYPRSLKGVRNICTAALFVENKKVFEEKGEVQFNEKGVSGIPILQGSCYASKALSKGKNVRLRLDLLPEIPLDSLTEKVFLRARETEGMAAERIFTAFLPKALYFNALKGCGISPSEPLTVSKKAAAELASGMKFAQYNVLSAAGFENAQAAGGGVDTRVIDADTLEIRGVGGLYVCGEAADVVGFCGGYNLLWAWASGRLAGKSAAEALFCGKASPAHMNKTDYGQDKNA